VTDRRRLTLYEESIKQESPPTTTSLERLYEESGLIFPDAVKKTLNDARNFHRQIVSNRSAFLKTEIKRIRDAIATQEVEIKNITEQRAEVLQVLKTHCSLKEMTKLQERNVELRGNKKEDNYEM